MTQEPSGKVRKSFSTINPKLQVAWDSVSLGALKRCPRFYQLSIVEGWQGKTTSLHLRFGILYHRADEVYQHKIMEGLSHDEALIFTLKDLAEGCQDWEPLDEIQVDEGYVYGDAFEGDRVRYSKIFRQGKETEMLAVDRRKGWWDPNEGLSEKKASANTKSIYTLFRSVVWYLDQYGANDPAKTIRLANGKPAVELSFRYEIGFTFKTGEVAFHCGHLDRVAEFNGDNYFLDKKTTASTIEGNSSWGYFAKFSPDNQMSGYSLASKIAFGVPVVGGIIDAVQIAKGFSRFERGFVIRTEAQLEEWRNDACYFIGMAELYAEAEHWPMNDTACDMYGGCPMREICSKDPAVRDVYLKANFHKRPWDPLEIRGDI